MVEISPLDKRARLVALRDEIQAELSSSSVSEDRARALIGRANEFPEIKAELAKQHPETSLMAGAGPKKLHSKIKTPAFPIRATQGDGKFRPTPAQQARSALFILGLQIAIGLISLLILGLVFWYAPA